MFSGSRLALAISSPGDAVLMNELKGLRCAGFVSLVGMCDLQVKESGGKSLVRHRGGVAAILLGIGQSTQGYPRPGGVGGSYR
jgi:hypothetical protein